MSAITCNNPKCASFTIDTPNCPGSLDDFGPSKGQGQYLGRQATAWYLVSRYPHPEAEIFRYRTVYLAFNPSSGSGVTTLLTAPLLMSCISGQRVLPLKAFLPGHVREPLPTQPSSAVMPQLLQLEKMTKEEESISNEIRRDLTKILQWFV